MGSENRPCEEKASFYSWSVILNYGQNLGPGAPFGSLGLPVSQVHLMGTEEAILLLVTQLSISGIAHQQGRWAWVYRLCTAQKKLGCIFAI